MNFQIFKPILNSAKTLLGKKSTQDILKYLAKVTVKHVCKKYGLGQQKYDPNDMKNMIYHYNNNTNKPINKNNVDNMINMLSINRFVDEVNKNSSNDVMKGLVTELNNLTRDNIIIDTYNEIYNNDMIRQFDKDTLKTSSLVDGYEMNSGGIYIPNRDIMTSTIEGCKLADAKNEYLEKRLGMGEHITNNEHDNLIKDYCEKVEFEKVFKYFNN